MNGKSLFLFCRAFWRRVCRVNTSPALGGMASPEGSRAGSNALGEVGAAVDSGHAARPVLLDGPQDALPARASAARAPIADGVLAAQAGNA